MSCIHRRTGAFSGCRVGSRPSWIGHCCWDYCWDEPPASCRIQQPPCPPPFNGIFGYVWNCCYYNFNAVHPMLDQYIFCTITVRVFQQLFKAHEQSLGEQVREKRYKSLSTFTVSVTLSLLVPFQMHVLYPDSFSKAFSFVFFVPFSFLCFLSFSI